MKDSTKQDERRRTPRIPVDFPVTLTLGRKQYRLQAREFSEFGILLASTYKELVGEDVTVELTLNPTSPSLSLEGVIAYATDTNVAIRFKNISPEHRAILKSYIQAHSSNSARQ